MLSTKTNYREPVPDSYAKARDKSKTNNMIKKLKALGYEVKEKDLVV